VLLFAGGAGLAAGDALGDPAGRIVPGPLFGAAFGVPAWDQDLSPFTHVPKVLAVPFDAARRSSFWWR
jgi:hypothetical protein